MQVSRCLRLFREMTLGVLFALAVSHAQTSESAGEAAPAPAALAPNASRGSDKAPITILVFSDFESFPCARSASVIDGLLQQTRDVRVIFKHAPAVSNPNAMLAHEAALAAGAQGKFWEMHDTLFENQTKLTRTDLLGYAKSLGLDIESLLAGIPPDKRVQPEIVAAGPAQQIDLSHAPTRGPATAPISLVEFSDFECPYCAETAPVVHQLLLAYPSQVRFAFKHYPLPMHKES